MRIKILILSLFTVFCVSVFLTGCDGSNDNGPIKWKDPVIEAAFRDWLGKPDEDIYIRDLNSVTRVTVCGEKIYIDKLSETISNAPLAYITGSGEEINTDEHPEYYLDSLGSRRLFFLQSRGTNRLSSLSTSKITTLSDFSNCRYLCALDLFNTDFKKLKGVKDLSGLRYLSRLQLYNNENLRDINGLSNLSSVDFLGITDMKELSDFSAVKDMTGLTTLYLENVSINNLKPVGENKSLERVSLINVPATDLSPLKKLPFLVFLHYVAEDGTEINDIKELDNY